MSLVRLAGTVPESVVDGPGMRFVIFAQGCPHRCDGCHNPETWDVAEGELVSLSELISFIGNNPLLRGITLSGGEPFLQAKELYPLARAVKEKGMDVVTYTGYTWEALQKMAAGDNPIQRLMELSDYIVDGPFIKDLRDISLPFRGSANQRIIDVAASLSSGDIVPASWGIR